MAIANVLGNLGEIAQGYQGYQTRALQQSQIAAALAQRQQQQQLLQNLYPVVAALQQQPGGMQGMASAPGGLYGGAPPGAAPVAPMQTQQLADLTPGAPGAGPALPQVGGAAAGLDGQPMAPQVARPQGVPSDLYGPSGAGWGVGGALRMKPTVLGLEGARPGQFGAAGEEGRMQVMPGTEQAMGFPRGTALYSDAPGDKFLTQLQRKADAAVLAGYNRGEGGMNQYLRGGLGGMSPQPAPAYAAAIQHIEQTGQMVGQAAGPQVGQQTTQAATNTLQTIDPSQIGRATSRDIVQAIEKAIPDADPKIKSLVWTQLLHVMNPQDQMLGRFLLQRDKDAVQLEMQGMRSADAAGRMQTQLDIAAGRAKTAEEMGQIRMDIAGMRQAQSGGQLYTPPGGGAPVWAFPSGQTRPSGLEPGSTKSGSQPRSGSAMALRTFMEEYQAREGKPPGSAEIRNFQAGMAEATSEARGVGTRLAGLESASNTLEALIPLVKETSNKISRTNYPDINSLILAAETKTGGTTVVQYGEMVNTLRYAYARAMAPSGAAPRVADLQHFDEIFNKNWSTGQVDAGLEQIQRTINIEKAAMQKTRESVRSGTTGQPTQAPAGQPSAQPTLRYNPDTGNLDPIK